MLVSCRLSSYTFIVALLEILRFCCTSSGKQISKNCLADIHLKKQSNAIRVTHFPSLYMSLKEVECFHENLRCKNQPSSSLKVHTVQEMKVS